jgi:hypothetical protein
VPKRPGELLDGCARKHPERGWILPHCGPMVAAMKTVAAIFVLALITIAFGAYSDHALTRGQILQTSTPDPATLAVANALKHK